MSDPIRIKPPKLNIDEIVETGAYYFEEDPDVIYVECKAADELDDMCPECGSIKYVKNGHDQKRRIHDISIGTCSVDIMLSAQRYKCMDCGLVFRRPYHFVDENVWMTRRLVQLIAKRAINNSFKSVAEEFGITIPTISKILKGYGSYLESQHKLVAPRVLGIDENHIGHVMRGIFTDIENGTLIEMTEDNKVATIEKTIMSMQDYDKNIEIVCMDMSAGYKGVVQMCLPKAKIVVDKFHVVRYIYSATETTRKQIFQKLKDQVDLLPEGAEKDEKTDLLKRMGKDSYLFKFSTKKVKMDPARTSLMSRLCTTFPELNELRLTKMRAEKIYDSTTPLEANNNINNFIKNIPSKPEYAEFQKFSRTLNRWNAEVINYFKYGKQYTNAATEGVNSLIKQLNGVGRGYTFHNLRTKALCASMAHNKPKLKARKKPTTMIDGMLLSNGYNNHMDILRPQNDEIMVSGDSSDIQVLLNNFDEIF